MEGVYARHPDIGRRSRTSIAMMFTEVKFHSCSHDRHIQRQIRLETVLHCYRKSQKFTVKLPRFCHIKDAQIGIACWNEIWPDWSALSVAAAVFQSR